MLSGLQTDLPQDTGFPRWGCLAEVPKYGAEQTTGKSMPRRRLIDLIRVAQSTPVPWAPGKHVIDFDPIKNTFWINNVDWWCQHIVDALDPGRWIMQPTGQQRPDGTMRWFADESWGAGRPKAYSFIGNRYGRHGGAGGHYIYENVYTETIKNPDPSLTGTLEILPALWAFHIRRR